MPLTDRPVRSSQDSASDPTNWPHLAIVILVFSITGFISVLISKLVLNDLLQLSGDLWSGPWSYRAAYLVLIPPSYSVTLVAVGTLFGKHHYFKRRVLAMWGRLLPRAVHGRFHAGEKR